MPSVEYIKLCAVSASGAHIELIVHHAHAGQLKTATYKNLDLAVFITDTNRTLAWAQAGFNSSLQFAIPGSGCAQNTTHQQICEAGLAELKPNERYFLWSASG